MDARLKERLAKWNLQIEVLSKVEETFFLLEGSEDTLEGQLFLQAKGDNIKERESAAYSSEDWIKFKQGLAMKKAEYNKEKRILDLKIKAYESEYLTMKIEAEMINKGKGGQL